MSENNWLDDLPEPLREAPYLKAAESPEDALAKIQHAAKLVGTSVRIPGEDASDDDRNSFYEKLTAIDGVARLPTNDDIDGVIGLLTKLGYPEDHTGYELPEVADFEWDKDMGEQMRHYAHKAGMTPGQFTAFAQQIAEQELGVTAEMDNELDDARKALRLDWGDTLEEREGLIRGWLEMSQAPEEMRELLNDRKLPLGTMNWLLSIAKQFEGDIKPISKDGKDGEPPMTPDEAKVELSKILSDLTNMRETDPRYKQLQQRMVQMQRLAMGSQAA
jgi:hypothetical protein